MGAGVNRKQGGWDQQDWLGYPKEDPAGAWRRLPALLQAALVWSFLKNGPGSVEDLARLHDGLCFGERGPIALAEREEPRWMTEALKRLLPTLSWAQVDTAVSIFLGSTNPRSVKNRRLKAGESSDKEDTWGMARKGEEGLQPFEAADYQRWLPPVLPTRSDFVVWLFAAWDFHLYYRRKQRREARKADPDFPPLPDPNGVYEDGLKFPVDMGEWWLQKNLFDRKEGLMWGYRLWRTNGALAVDSYKVYTKELQRGVYPNGGLLCVRPAGPNTYVGGTPAGLKDFNAMIRAALDEMGSPTPGIHLQALLKDLNLDELRRIAMGTIPFLLARWWRRVGPGYRGRQLRVRHLGMAKAITHEIPEKVSN
jgi:hypothetical protein